VTKEQNELAMKLRRLWTTYSQNRDLVQVGAYQSGTNLELDEAIGKKSAIDEFLKQDQNDSFTFDESIGRLSQALMT
jgi:flagellum-specific ATP synthase